MLSPLSNFEDIQIQYGVKLKTLPARALAGNKTCQEKVLGKGMMFRHSRARSNGPVCCSRMCDEKVLLDRVHQEAFFMLALGGRKPNR